MLVAMLKMLSRAAESATGHRSGKAVGSCHSAGQLGVRWLLAVLERRINSW